MKQAISAGFVVWFTGLPASGKTTLANVIKELLAEQGVRVVVLDSDDLRSVLTPEPAYSEEEREWFYNVIAYLAGFLAKEGINVLIAATAHRRRYRERARERVGRFAEVYVQCSLEACKERDPNGIYALAESGVAESVPGVGADYERPLQPEATVDTTNSSPQEAARMVVAQLQAAKIITERSGEEA